MVQTQIRSDGLVGARTIPAPVLTGWIPERNPLGVGLVIFPGGAYAGLADHEGRGYAEYFCRAGLACFVVEYRLGSQGFRHPAMLEDALAAIQTVRKRAVEFGLDPGRLGVMGSSAGGHLAAHAMVAWHDYPGGVTVRPDFGVLCYPVIVSRPPHTHAESMVHLAGPAPSAALLDELSCEKRVRPDTPPCFLWHTGEDTAVPPENSMLFAQALQAHGVPIELHLYAHGGHGLGLGAPFDWASDCLRWIHETVPRRARGPTSP